MESVQWINGSYKEDNYIFETHRQAEMWANALYPDFALYLFSKTTVGYATPDEKVIKCLAELLPEWISYNNNTNGSICLGEEKINGKIIYKIWIENLT
ncbi:hypothetical protein [Gottfriedia acidiceleris]|uniref:hypothetical protein n=1 Tax=Gottfriedia acidiceleris TaxID=371036 RepID=UPI00111BE8C5|nr:hypothetical protein [Gottfriedia acidiceleris]